MLTVCGESDEEIVYRCRMRLRVGGEVGMDWDSVGDKAVGGSILYAEKM